MCFGGGLLHTLFCYAFSTLGSSLGSKTATLRHAFARRVTVQEYPLWGEPLGLGWCVWRWAGAYTILLSVFRRQCFLGTSLGSKAATLRHALAGGMRAQESHFWSGLVALIWCVLAVGSCTSYSFICFQKATRSNNAQETYLWCGLLALGWYVLAWAAAHTIFYALSEGNIRQQLSSKTAIIRHRLAIGLGAQESHLIGGPVAFG